MFERESAHHPQIELPVELAEALRGSDYACLTTATDLGTAFVIKAPAEEISRLRGPIPIELRHELYQHPAAPVIRLLLRFYDDPLAPLAMESFINAADPLQRAEYAALAEQPQIPLLFYDQGLQHRLSKQMSHHDPALVREVLAAAEILRVHIPSDLFNFDVAKRAIQEVVRW